MTNAPSPPESGKSLPDSQSDALTVQSALPSVLGPAFLPGLARPTVDEAFIDQAVGSSAERKVQKVIKRHRAVWKAHFGSAAVELRHECRRLRHRVSLTRWQANGCRLRLALTPGRTWFLEWPSWAVFMLLLAFILGAALTVMPIVGVYKLLQNTPGLADSPLSCAVIATIVGGCVVPMKFGLAAVEDQKWKRRFCVTSAALTAVLSIAFFVLLAFQTGGLAASTVPVDSVGVDAAVIGRPWLSPHLQYVQLLLEWMASLTLFLFSDVLLAVHGYPTSKQSPRKIFWSQQLTASEQALRDEEQAMGRAQGNLAQLEAEEDAFVASAMMSFERKAELARRQEDGLRRQRGEPVPPPRRSWLDRIRNLFK